MSVGPTDLDVLARSAGRPDALALVGVDGTWTYAELDGLVSTRAEKLEAEGVGAGRLRSVVVEPDPDGVVDLLATWRAGAVAAPLNPRLTEAERAVARAELDVAPEGAIAVLWTSGTAGRPRGVALSLANLEASARASAERLSLSASDVWLASLSPAHVGGLALLVRSVLLGGALVAVGRFEAGHASDLLTGSGMPVGGRAAITHASLVPTQLRQLLDARSGDPPPPTFRCALVGGAHAPRSLVERALRARWPVALTYGATEMSSQIATAQPDETRRKAGAVGRPLPGVELRLAEDGELLVRGPTQAIGYVGRGGALLPLVDGEGWYHTGDLGRLDDDGDLWIVGRRSDRIVTGGVNVDALEVEEALRAHPAVIDACVVGLTDETWGERVAAWVEPVEGELDLDELERWLRGRISGAKRPRSWRVAPGLPRNANGKVDRVAVRAALEQR